MRFASFSIMFPISVDALIPSVAAVHSQRYFCSAVIEYDAVSFFLSGLIAGLPLLAI